jgi:hypothetical protein
MFKRQLAIVALVGTVLAAAGCSCHHKGTTVGYGSPCCGAPAGAVAVPAVPAAPVPVTSSYGVAAPCPTCVGR